MSATNSNTLNKISAMSVYSPEMVARGSMKTIKNIEECILLYVEDDDPAAYLFQAALEDVGLFPRIYRVTDGDHASAFLFQTGAYESAPTPDLVLLDLNLPRKSGFDVLAEIRRDLQLRDVPVIVFSTSVYPHDRERALELGATEYISKPNDYDALVRIAKSVCQRLPTGPALKSA